jgi:UDP-N-acetylglucosamine--N-acetylmuramyl-(pentapeptide) pyrophosphoryl-undecaprenol N-acetylglucosamine transferase
MKILVAGGGTGGHFYPALAIIEGVRQHPQLKSSEIAYVGTKRGIEARVLAQPQHRWIRFCPIRARGLDRGHLGRFLLALLEMPIGLIQTLKFIRQFKPDLIIGVGGYAAFSSLLWGIMLRVPTLIHEQNIQPGLVNKLLARWVSRVCLTHQQTQKYFTQLPPEKVLLTGLPVRPSLTNIQPDYTQFGLQPTQPVIFVVGGSRGSEFLNKTVLEAFPQLEPKDVQLILVTGNQANRCDKNSAKNTDARVVLVPYLEEIGRALALADLVVCRAGATTLAELAVTGKPAILVPWPGAAENHQYENARALAESGGCLVAPETDLDARKLAELINHLLNNREKLTEMKSRMSALGRTAALDQILREVEVLVYA